MACRGSRLYAELFKRKDWVETLRTADAVFVAAHSQGSVVSTQLLARLVEEKHVQGDRTALLCMCAIAQGPCEPSLIFFDAGKARDLIHVEILVVHLQSSLVQSYLSYFETAAARELFDFQDPETAVAKRFRDW